MHRVGAGLLAGLDDLVDQQIGLRRGRRADMHRLVGHADVKGRLVGVGIDRDGTDTHLLRRAHHAAGDLATIGDQDFLNHRETSDIAVTPAKTGVQGTKCGV